jgi:hypothetical protein
MDQKKREALVEELVDFLRSSTVRGSDAGWYTGFKSDTPVENKRPTYLQHWDGYYAEDTKRDSGTYSYRLQQLENKKTNEIR